MITSGMSFRTPSRGTLPNRYKQGNSARVLALRGRWPFLGFLMTLTGEGLNDGEPSHRKKCICIHAECNMKTSLCFSSKASEPLTLIKWHCPKMN